jgi:hypothetical protein
MMDPWMDDDQKPATMDKAGKRKKQEEMDDDDITSTVEPTAKRQKVMKSRLCSACHVEKQPHEFSKRQRGRGAEARCFGCVSNGVSNGLPAKQSLILCPVCSVEKDALQFSSSQRIKGTEVRCRECHHKLRVNDIYDKASASLQLKTPTEKLWATLIGHGLRDGDRDVANVKEILDEHPHLIKSILRGQTLLHVAGKCRQLGHVQLLTERFPEALMMRDNNGLTPLHAVASRAPSKAHGTRFILVYLIDRDPETVRVLTNIRRTVLHTACAAKSRRQQLAIIVEKWSVACLIVSDDGQCPYELSLGKIRDRKGKECMLMKAATYEATGALIECTLDLEG